MHVHLHMNFIAKNNLRPDYKINVLVHMLGSCDTKEYCSRVITDNARE